MVARNVVRVLVLFAVVFLGLLTAPSRSPVPVGTGAVAATYGLSPLDMPTDPAAPPPPPCGERSPVALNPTAGPAGTQVTATGCGWTPGSQITVSWENQQTLATTTVDVGGGFTVSFTVPATAPPGDHQVLFTQSCTGCVSRLETALFNVTAPAATATPTPTPTNTPVPPPPSPCDPNVPVMLNPSVGPKGTFVTATGCGWTPGSQVTVSWNNEEPLTTTTVNPDGTFTASFTVPEDADEGLHQEIFSQSCTGGCLSRFATATFTVT